MEEVQLLAMPGAWAMAGKRSYCIFGSAGSLADRVWFGIAYSVDTHCCCSPCPIQVWTPPLTPQVTKDKTLSGTRLLMWMWVCSTGVVCLSLSLEKSVWATMELVVVMQVPTLSGHLVGCTE